MSPSALTEKLIPLHAAGDDESMAEVARLTKEADKSSKPKSKPRPKAKTSTTRKRK